jgi:predicted nucleic acid-binding protein
MASKLNYVLDTFALLAYLKDESGAARIEEILEQAEKEKCHLFVSIINLGEVFYIVERKGGISEAQNALALIGQLPVEVLPANEQTVFAAAHIKATHRLSYADAFAVVGALNKNAVVLTGDPEFVAVESIVKVEWLAKK